VLLLAYHLLLEKEKMHQFNRFYLLFSLIFSLVIPHITIKVVKEITTPIIENSTINFNQESTVFVEETNYFPIIIWSIYGLITLLLSIRFVRNILKIITKINSNTRIDYENATLVLLKEKALPYTFLNYIFMSEMDYTNQKIEAELFSHELTHVTQKHTWDVLLIEFLKTIFWFNPIFIFYKKAIQLNHEFLADEKVVKNYNNIPFYQNLLLSKANENQTFYLASNLNYLLTKKRLIMMTKTTSTTRALLKKATLIPLLMALVFSICTKAVAQETAYKVRKDNYLTQEAYYKKTTFKIKNEKGAIVAEKKYGQLTQAEKKLVPSYLAGGKTMPTKEELDELMKKGGPDEIIIDAFDPKNIKTKKEGSDEVYNTSEITVNPEFPNGMEAFYKFVGENFTVPETPKDVKLAGKVYATFIIETNGEISNIKILRDIGYGTGEEVIRVLKLSPKWIPGKINDEAVRTAYSLPITIQSKS
jgi:beta-lactamase regulating signal transducer with metallopeptidase domain